ncbi:PepSY-associated TM helix domain-containing protein [Gottfriedia acidiceleris]|uniref:PepSY-associated TM helix domain-containing protein n=1 Tax=Gottfriedia acidiceleris TaxID=371036 RepID=UPI001F27228B|nr:PepSY domain-containing protein [Gottfriedia acidiceleris]
MEVDQNGEITTVFINQYNGKILGNLKSEDRFVNKIVKIHGELMAGTIGDRIVEMTASWAMILLVTGLYLWWPRKKEKIMGLLIPRFSKGKRMLLRDLHAVPAFWFSIFISIFIFTGLPWSGLLGNIINKFATATHTSYPIGLYDGNIPSSKIIS